MKRMITAAAKYEQKLRNLLSIVKRAWDGHSNIDVEVADDGRGITFPDKDGNPIALRIKVVMVPEYHILDAFQEDVVQTTDQVEFVKQLSEMIEEYRS